MKLPSAIILAVLLVTTEGKVVPASENVENVENQQTGTQSLQLSDHIKEAKNAIDNFSAQLQQQLNLPNQEEFLNAMREQSTNFVNNVQGYIQNMTDEIKAKSPELETIWTNMKNKLSQTLDNLNPETTEQVNQLRTKFQDGIDTLVTESETIARNINENSSKVQESIAKLAKQAVNIAMQASQDLNNQLQQAATSTPQP